MKITIDTKEDSEGDIRKVIFLLKTLVDDKEQGTDENKGTETEKEEVKNNFASMGFMGSQSQPAPDNRQKEEKEEEKSSNEPRIVTY
ncbi:MAG: hypothetical protein ACQEP1_00425 [Nanobdellota archaeon]